VKILAFIPARANSKGIKNKNMALLNKKPLIYYTLDILKKIKKDVFPFVSTDSKKIKKYCEKFGFQNEYLRPKYLSEDNSSMLKTLNHAIKWLKINRDLKFDAVLLLQPTSPIRKLKDIRSAIYQFKQKRLKSLVSVIAMKEHPYDCVKFNKNKLSFLVNNTKNITNRQFYEKNYYYIDGSFYLAKVNFLKKYKNFLNEKYTKIFIQKIKWPIDIDEPEDLLFTDIFLKKKKLNKILCG
jgi:CMP-N-acetylneuraminic acid synthetase|tara:strand:+ start:751 stop:1467 length:717 start_codon:yes stop_codon:yes gene_type:complete